MTTAVNATLAGQRPLFTLTPLGALTSNLGAGGKNLFSGVASPDAVIEALFASGEQGAFYDPSDLSTLFQDSAGTTPVTADGQPVGLILDKSGRSNHASQATAAKRPLYKTSGGLHWLQFDGVDDSLSTAAIDFTATDKMSVFSGVYAAVGNIEAFVISFGAFFDNGSFSLAASLSGGGNRIYQATKGTVDRSRAKYDLSYPFTKVLTGLSNNAGATNPDQNKLRVNAADPVITYDGGPTTAGNYANAPLYIGATLSASSTMNGNIYSLIALGRLATTQEITDTETWVNGKTGAY